MASIFKRKGDQRWTMSWFDFEGNRRERSTGTTDKKLAQRLANAAEDAELERKRGLVDPLAERIAEGRNRPLSDHIDDYENHLLGLGRDDDHVAQTVGYLRTMSKLIGWQSLASVSADALLRHLSEQGEKRKFGARTFNARLVAWRAFCRWCVANYRLASNPLASLAVKNVDGDRRRVRRDITVEELGRILKVAAHSPTVTVRKKAGKGKVVRVTYRVPDRCIAYLIAAETGFRASEVSSLTPESFDLSATAPTITVLAGYSKRRRHDEQPIRPPFAEMLRTWLASKTPQKSVCPLPKSRAGLILAADMDAARRLWIDEATTDKERARREASDFLRPVDAAGRVADFHSFRVHYISRVVETGATIKEAMTLARHADPKLTLKTYAKVGMSSLSRVLDKMPRPSAGPIAEPQTLRATGTDDCPHSGPHSQHVSDSQGATGNENATHQGGVCNEPKTLKLAELCESVRPDADSRVNTGERSRTFNLLIRSQVGNTTNQGDSDQCPHSGPHSSAKPASDAPLADMLARWMNGNT